MSEREMIPIDSSLIKALAYDEANQQLTVVFQKGGTYVYSEVPGRLVDWLLASSSKGRFFLKEIKGVYPSEKQ